MGRQPTSHARFHRLNEITLGELRALDRSRTAAILPVGMVEQHAEHLPLGTDNFAVDGLTLALVAWLLENDPGLHILLLPTIPFGTDPIDLRRRELFESAGSIWLSAGTLRAVVEEVVGHLIRYGFRHIFPVGFHGGPQQSQMLESLCADLRAQHAGLVMYEPTGYVMAGGEAEMIPGLETLLGRPLTPAEQVALKGSIHASMFETSMMLSLRPDLVKPTYKNLRTIEWNQLYTMESWPGYVGAGPAHADAELGGAALRWRGVRAGALVLRAIRGEDLSKLTRHPVWEDEGDFPDVMPVVDKPHVDANPVMHISADDLERAKKKAAAQDGDEDDDPDATQAHG
jgi:creatinine amidohydrolase